MNFLPNGCIQFEDLGEMWYNLFLEMGLALDANGYLYDIDTHIQIRFKDKLIKADVRNNTIYAGRSDIVFDPANNYFLTATVMGYYLDKFGQDINFSAYYIEDNEDKDKQRVVVKYKNGTEMYSNFYNNVYLAFVETIFRLSDQVVDLSGFDILI